MSSLPLLHDERWTLGLGLGLLGILLYTGHRQLVDFRERCAITPGSASKHVPDGDNVPLDSDIVINDGKLLLTLEKAIKLDTLETIARGPSYDLRIAALKIICQRAMAGDSYATLLAQVCSDNALIRIRGLKSLRCVYQLVGSNNISQPIKSETFRSVITSLQKALKDRQFIVQEKTGEKEGILFLAKTITGWGRSTELAIDAGLVEFLKEWNDWENDAVKNYLSALTRPHHGTGDLDLLMSDVVESVYRSSNGRKELRKVGLLPERAGATPEVEAVEVIIQTQSGPVWLESMRIATEVAEGILEATREARAHVNADNSANAVTEGEDESDQVA